jgi:hypothetical protein
MIMGEARHPQAVFALSEAGLADTMPEVLGLWATIPSSSADVVAFDAASVTVADAPVWRANLPADLRLAHAHLAEAEGKVQSSQRALAAAADRLQAFVEAQAAGVAFGVSAVERPLAEPEAALWGLLREIQEGGPPVSFGLGERLAGGWERATQQIQAALEQLRQVVAHFACVETRVQEQFLAQTTVSWTGDVDTVWRAEVSPEQAQLHKRTLALALESRETLLRTAVMAT